MVTPPDVSCRWMSPTLRAFEERAGWEFLENLMSDPKKCGAFYCDVALRNARIAQHYMTTLTAAKHDVEERPKDVYTVR